MDASLEKELSEYLAGLGFELVTLERGGGKRRPVLRLRVDRPDGTPGRSSVTLDDCAAVSRAVTEYLEERDRGEVEWILEVSSPGVDRPLKKPGDYSRFAGSRVRIRGYGPLVGDSRQIVGRLIGLESEAPGGEAVIVEVNGERVVLPLSGISRATLALDFAEEL